MLANAFLIPWTGGAFAPLGPFLCPTTEEEKMAYCPKARALGPVLRNEFNIEKTFECLACNLLQISSLKLCFKKLRFLKKCVLRCRKCFFRDPHFKNFLEGMCPRPPS
jgi:hypothetical protein